MSESELPINTWDQVKEAGGRVFISAAYSPGRGRRFNGYRVVGIGFDTRPDGPWYEHGCKTFVSFSIGRKAALEAAKAWVGEHYGIKRWKRNKMHDYIDADLPTRPLRKECI